jgi:hypothetical protein
MVAQEKYKQWRKCNEKGGDIWVNIVRIVVLFCLKESMTLPTAYSAVKSTPITYAAVDVVQIIPPI